MTTLSTGAPGAHPTPMPVHITLPDGPLSPFGPSVAIDRAVIVSALHANPRTGEAFAMAASAILYFRKHRTELLAFAEIVTDLADMIDGDPDFEDATDAEDDHALSPDALFFSDDAAGCAVGDPGEHDGTEQGDTSWTEWHTRGRQKDNPGMWCRDGRQLLEDMEDDDRDSCPAADDQGMAGGRWFDTDGGPGDPEDAEDGHDREGVE